VQQQWDKARWSAFLRGDNLGGKNYAGSLIVNEAVDWNAYAWRVRFVSISGASASCVRFGLTERLFNLQQHQLLLGELQEVLRVTEPPTGCL